MSKRKPSYKYFKYWPNGQIEAYFSLLMVPTKEIESGLWGVCLESEHGELRSLGGNEPLLLVKFPCTLKEMELLFNEGIVPNCVLDRWLEVLDIQAT